MAEKFEAFRRFDYRLNSNLVIQKETHNINQNEPTGEPESLVGRTLYPMGDKVVRMKPKDLLELNKKRVQQTAVKLGKSNPVVSEETKSVSSKVLHDNKLAHEFRRAIKKGPNILRTDIHESNYYHPTTKENTYIYESILDEIKLIIGDQPNDVLLDATEEILYICKSEIRDLEKKSMVINLLGDSCTNEKFQKIYNLVHNLNDYVPKNALSDLATATNVPLDDDLDNTGGVAVIFDEDDDNELIDYDINNKIIDDTNNNDTFYEEEEEEDEEDKLNSANDKNVYISIKDDQREKSADILFDNKYNLNVRDIDTHWLQRELTRIYNDVEVAADLEKKILNVLTTENLQECENKLVYLLKYDNFNFAKLLLKNQWKVYFCTKLGQAQSSVERDNILKKMSESPYGQEVLKELEAVKLRTDREKEFTRNVQREAAILAERSMNLSNKEDEDDILGDRTVIDPFAKKNVIVNVQASEKPPPKVLEEKDKGEPEILNLEAMTFTEGCRFMANTSVKLGESCERIELKEYDEVIIPPPIVKETANEYDPEFNKELLVEECLPKWAQDAFTCVNIKRLNKIQSAVFHIAYSAPSKNMLICAPTGAGKTNIAVLSILSIINQNILNTSNKQTLPENLSTDIVDTPMADNPTDFLSLNEISLLKKNIKVVYLSPMKALVNEQVLTLSKRFSPYGLIVEELTGDSHLTRSQLREANIIIATPEKWDIITRKTGEINEVISLIIFDEIHLLHDTRGSIIECIVARTLRYIESSQQPIRLIGLSATLPNYMDIALFLRVSLTPNDGLFVFGSLYRPVPLKQTFIGLKEKKPTKRLLTTHNILYNKVIEELKNNNSILIFVHSRKETAKTGNILKKMFLEKETVNLLIKEENIASNEILKTESEACKNTDLKELLLYGIGIHHAGLPRTDRRLIEDLFSDKHVSILISTATLAWGVNLPAHTVIIKGTQIYNPAHGAWEELSMLDMMQMIGRAGRPQFDLTGHGIVITTHNQLQYYLSLLNQQLPIESQLLHNLPDILNSEIQLGTIATRADAVKWIQYTYFYIRILREPSLYGLPEDVRKNDSALIIPLTNIVHTALCTLEKYSLIRYERRLGMIQRIGLGRIASYYYIKYPSICTYNEHLRPTFTDIELLRLFSLSHEFKYIPVRDEEKAEITRLLERVPIPVKGSASTQNSSVKINILLQAYISRLSLVGFALNADMIYVTQNASRIMRALFEISLKRSWAFLAKRTLLFCKMIHFRMWNVLSPLRQFSNVLTEDVLKKLEKKNFPWERYYHLNPVELGELIRAPKLGNVIHRLVHTLPKMDISASIQPLTPSTLLIECTLTPDFKWDSKYHDIHGEAFWIILEDNDQDVILHYEMIRVYQNLAEITIDFAVPLTEPLPPNYFLRCISDKWIQSESLLAISFKNLILPQKNPQCTELLDLQPVPIYNLKYPEAEKMYNAERITHFGPVESQVIPSLYHSNDNVLVCAPTNAYGLKICAEFAILRMLKESSVKRCVYLTPYESWAENRYNYWKSQFGEFFPDVKVVMLTGDTSVDLILINEANIIVSIATHWDCVSRRWRTRKVLQQIPLFIVDNLEALNSRTGSILEVCFSRMRYISAQLPNPIRFIGLSIPLANAIDIAGWFAVDHMNMFNFPSSRGYLKTYIEAYEIYSRSVRLASMAQPTYQWIKKTPEYSVILICSDRKQCRIMAVNFLLYSSSDNKPYQFLHLDKEKIVEEMQKYQITDKTLQRTLQYGVGYIHEGLNPDIKNFILELYKKKYIQVLIIMESLIWSLQITAQLVIVQDTIKYHMNTKRWKTYDLVDIFRMMSLADDNKSTSSMFVLMCPQSRWTYYSKFISEPIPLESALDQGLTDFLNAEIALKTIESKQDAVDWLTWSFYYRRLTKNPNYYGLQGSTPTHLSEHLSELIENSVDALTTGQCIEVDPENQINLTPLNLSLIAAFYYINFTTIDLYNRSVGKDLKKKALIEILCAASEFTDLVPFRFGEEDILKTMANETGVYLGPETDVNDPNVKALILYHSHIHRSRFTSDLAWDRKLLLDVYVRLLHALVDVIGSNGWFLTAIHAMELCQMTIQAMRTELSPLYQLPFFDEKRVSLAKSSNINDVYDLINADDDIRNLVLSDLSNNQIQMIATMCNAYPVINVDFDIPAAIQEKISDDSIIYALDCNSSGTLVIQLSRVVDNEEEEISPVMTQYYSKPKDEQWWVVLGSPKTNNLLAIKRTVAKVKNQVKLTFDTPKEPGLYEYVLNVICDSYIGCDQEYSLKIRTQ